MRRTYVRRSDFEMRRNAEIGIFTELSNFIATIGIIGQFLIDYIISNKKCKKVVGLILMLFADLGIWGSYYLQEKANKSLSKNLNEIKKSNIKLTSNLEQRNADQLKEVFTQAGWKVDGIDQALYKNAVNGIIIKIKNKELPDHIKAIARSLNLIRMKPTAWLNPDNNEEKVDIIVGSRS